MNRRILAVTVLAVAIAGLIAASPAQAKGGASQSRYAQAKGVVGVGGVSAGVPPSPRAITDQSGDDVYVAQPTDDGTALGRVVVGQGPVRSRFSSAGFTIPIVALDKSTSGLSANGRTLVLSQALLQLGQSSTRFQIVDPQSLRVRDTIMVRGSYGFDAISPDGNLIYLIQYLSPVDPSRYLVRAYDVQAGRLLHKPVIDPSESGRPMTGKPVTRAMSPGGGWAYTLYRGSKEGPFVHALDTVRHRAVCVDLDTLELPGNISGSRLDVSDDGQELSIVRHGQSLGSIDTTTFAVTAPVSASATGGDGPPWLLIAAIAAAVLAACAIGSRTLLRRRGLASS
jgi:hypothetical protein